MLIAGVVCISIYCYKHTLAGPSGMLITGVDCNYRIARFAGGFPTIGKGLNYRRHLKTNTKHHRTTVAGAPNSSQSVDGTNKGRDIQHMTEVNSSQGEVEKASQHLKSKRGHTTASTHTNNRIRSTPTAGTHAPIFGSSFLFPSTACFISADLPVLVNPHSPSCIPTYAPDRSPTHIHSPAYALFA